MRPVSWFTHVVVCTARIICVSDVQTKVNHDEMRHSTTNSTMCALTIDDEKHCLLPAFACSERFEDVLLAALTCKKRAGTQSDKIVRI